MDKDKLLLPWYINETLSDREKTSVEMLIQVDPDAKLDYQSTQRASQVIRTQDFHVPSNHVRKQLLALVHEQPSRSKIKFHNWLWGAPIMLLISIILWLIVQPGTLLRWSINGDTPATFRIYRAPVGSTQFVLIDELKATPQQPSYQYADLLVVPGQTYQYMIEIRDQNGITIRSQAAISNSQMTFAAQIALLLTSLIFTFGIIKITQEIKSFPQLFLSF